MMTTEEWSRVPARDAIGLLVRVSTRVIPEALCEPNRIGRSGFEVAVEQIGRDRMGVAAVGGDRHPPPASRWTNAVLPH